jgi:hypothetical protein
MMEIVQGPLVAQFVGERCRAEFSEPYHAIGYTQNGEIVGGIVLNGFNGRNVDLSIAHTAKSWPVAFSRFFTDYVWDELKVKRISMHVRPSMVPMCLRMGAKLEGVLRNWYDDGDATLLGVLRDEWRFN